VLQEIAREEHQVLLVEDNPGDADLTSWRLSQAPTMVEVHQVATLTHAMGALRQGPFDAIILDLNLPDSQGLDTLQRIVPGSRGAPVIVVSGSVDESLRERALGLGAEDVFSKEQAAGYLFSRAVLYVIQRNRARAQHLRLEQLIDAAAEAVLIVDREGVVLYVSKAALVMLNRSAEDFVGERLAFPIQDAEVVEITLPRAQSPRLCEMRVVPYEWKERPAFLATLRDITLVRQVEARFRLLAESGMIGILTGDVGGLILDANETFLQMLGWSFEEISSGQLKGNDLVPTDYTEAAVANAMRLRSGGTSPAFEIELLRKNGTRVPVLLGAAMIDASTYVAYTVDISERREAEMAKRQVEEQLHKSEEQLRHAQKMEAVGRLAGGVAHDFNNLLSVILSFADLIHDSLDPNDPVRSDIEEIARAGERGAALTRQLLLFSRHKAMDQRPLDLNEVLSSMKRMVARILGEDVELAFVLDESIGKVLADRGSIEQVIMNLVVNARDAMPTGGKVTIESANVLLDDSFTREHIHATAGPHVMLAITDSGIGMDKPTQNRIFEPFFTTKELGKGTGLGLSTVFGIVRQSRGSIWVYSELGRGTTFKIYLPRTDGIVEQPRASGRALTLRGSETILVVEDDDQVRAIAISILRRYGYQVLEATSPEQALSITEQIGVGIDLMLSDVVMPQMSGPVLAKRILEAHPTMKVLCMSGYTDDSVVRHGVLSAEVPFLQKPFTPETLALKVREVLDIAKATRS
jgi:PAS domain S-box-containing protein